MRTIDRTVPNGHRAVVSGSRTRSHADASVDGRVFALDGGATEPREGPSPSGIVRMVRTQTGAAVVWTVAAAVGTEVLGLSLDPEGHARGVPRVLRTVPGRVEALDADARHGLLWVAFSTSMGTFGRWALRRTGALVASDDLLLARGPVIFEEIRVWPIRRRWREVFVEVRAGDDGTAAVLASSDNTACPAGLPTAARVAWVDCPGWKWFRVSQRPGVLTEGRGGTTQPEFVPGALTRVPQGWTYAHGPVEALASPMRVVFDPIPAGLRHRVLPAFTETVSFCERPRVAWTDDTWVLTCVPVADLHEPAGTVWIRAIRADGTAVTPARSSTARLTGEVLRCFHGHPVVELRWDQGVVRIDPTAPDASLRLEQWNAGARFDGVDTVVWAGRSLVGFDGRTGRLRRWRCTPLGEVLEE